MFQAWEKSARILGPLMICSLLTFGGCDLDLSISIKLWLGRASEDFSQSASLAGIETVRITTRNGSITVGVDDSLLEALIEGTKTAAGETDEEAATRLDEIEIRVEPNADDATILEVEAILPVLSGSIRDKVDFVITLPRGVDLELDCTNGDIEVEGNEGSVDADAANGAIDVTDNTGDVEANSSNGALTLLDIVGSVVGETANGQIAVKVTMPDNGTVDVKTNNGRITMDIAEEATASLDLQTSNGTILADLQGFVVTDLRSDINSLKATLNGGGGEIKGRTRNGRIIFSGF